MKLMTESPANGKENFAFLEDGAQVSDIPAFKHWAYQMVQALIQKNAGQERYKDRPGNRWNVNFKEIEAIENFLIMEAICLVLSEDLDKIESKASKMPIEKLQLEFELFDTSRKKRLDELITKKENKENESQSKHKRK